MQRPSEQAHMDRRALLLLGLAGASTLVLGTSDGTLAGEAASEVQIKVLNEGESLVPGFKTVRVREATWAPGVAQKERPMKNYMVCEMMAGELDVTVDGQQITRKQGDVWTCKPGQMISDINKGKAAAVMRVVDLLE